MLNIYVPGAFYTADDEYSDFGINYQIDKAHYCHRHAIKSLDKLGYSNLGMIPDWTQFIF